MVIYSPELQTLLNSLYSEPGRHYHNINHIKYLLAVAKQWRTEDISANDAVYTELQHTIWWHDAFYNIFSAPKPVACTKTSPTKKFLSLLYRPGAW